MRWSGRMSSSWWSSLWLPGRIDYAKEVGDGTGNSAVVATIGFIQRTFPEAPLAVWTLKADNTKDIEPAHPMVAAIMRPNEYYSGLLLWSATIADFAACGNAYWLKVRSGAGKIVELWYAPSWTMRPVWPDDGSEYLSGYEYKPDSSKPATKIDTADVVHFRDGIDPRNTRLGLSRLASVVREIYADDEAGNFTASLLRNVGIPGAIISPKKDTNIDRDTAEQIRNRFDERFTGAGRGRSMVMLGPTEVTMLGYSPEQMNVTSLRRIPEERISAVMGIPAIVAGLGAGLDRATYANFEAAKQQAYESALIPMQRLLAAELQTQLLPDFDPRPASIVGFDLSNVRVLQDDQDALYKREIDAVLAGVKMVGEARSVLGLQSGPEHDVFLVPATLQIVPKDYVVPPPPLPPAPIALPTPPTVTDVTPAPAQLPAPAKRRKSTKAAPKVTISDADLDDAEELFDAAVDPKYRGLLSAEVVP